MNSSNASTAISAGQEWKSAHETPLPAGAHCHEVFFPEWAAFCRWFTITFRGIELTAQQNESVTQAQATEAIDLPLEFIESTTLEDGVKAITLAVRAGSRLHRLNITAARHIRMYCNAAGWPIKLEILTSGGSVLLQFSGRIESHTEFTGNSWGE
jgi:hypothetical protein